MKSDVRALYLFYLIFFIISLPTVLYGAFTSQFIITLSGVILNLISILLYHDSRLREIQDEIDILKGDDKNG